MSEMDLVTAAKILTQVFGYWPSFHDAEVLTMFLDRDGEDGASLEARIHVFEITDEVDVSGFYVLDKHTLVTLRFGDIALRNLRWFNEQNSISGLDIFPVEEEEGDGRLIGVSFRSNHGVEADFVCRIATVLAAEPFEYRPA